jgi:hypothetical protein
MSSMPEKAISASSVSRVSHRRKEGRIAVFARLRDGWGTQVGA